MADVMYLVQMSRSEWYNPEAFSLCFLGTSANSCLATYAAFVVSKNTLPLTLNNNRLGR